MLVIVDHQSHSHSILRIGAIILNAMANVTIFNYNVQYCTLQITCLHYETGRNEFFFLFPRGLLTLLMHSSRKLASRCHQYSN